MCTAGLRKAARPVVADVLVTLHGQVAATREQVAAIAGIVEPEVQIRRDRVRPAVLGEAARAGIADGCIDRRQRAGVQVVCPVTP